MLRRSAIFSVTLFCLGKKFNFMNLCNMSLNSMCLHNYLSDYLLQYLHHQQFVISFSKYIEQFKNVSAIVFSAQFF